MSFLQSLDEQISEVVNPGAESTFRGSFVVSVGSNTQASYGMRYVHSYGPNYRLVNDGMTFGMELLLGTFNNPFVTPLTGLPGDATFVYGPSTTAVYGGPVINIRRGPVINKVTEDPGFFTGSVQDSVWQLAAQVLSGSPSVGPMAAEDLATQEIVAVMSLLLSTVTMALELTAKFTFPNYTAAGPYDAVPSLLNVANTLVVPRLLAFITMIEACGTWENTCTGTEPAAAQRVVAATSAAELVVFGFVQPPLLMLEDAAADALFIIELVGILIVVLALAIAATAAS